MAYDDDEVEDGIIKGRNFGVHDYPDNVFLHVTLMRKQTQWRISNTPVPLNFKLALKVPVFISARVDRWSAAARLLIGASPPMSHTHIDSLSSLLVQQPSCIPRPSASFLSPSLPFLFLFLSTPSLPLSSPLVSSSSSISSSCLSLHRYFHPLGLSAAVCLPIIPPPFIAPTASFVFLHVDQ